MAAKQAMKEKLQCTSKYGHLRISRDICHVRMADIEGFHTIYGHSDNLLNNKYMLFSGREVRIGKNCARCLEYVLKTSGTVFPYTDRPRPVNNVFIFFLQFWRWNEAN